MSLRPFFLAASLSVCVALVGCCTDPVNGDKWFCLSKVSDAQEVEIGAAYAPNFIAQSGGVYPDPEVQEALETIVIEKLARRSQRPDLPWKFTILNTSQINAFALPGGQVFVTRGLVALLESEAQFAHLMGHEVGHVCHRHSVRGQSRAQLFQVLMGTLAVAESAYRDESSEDPLYVTAAAGLAGQLAMLKFSRDQELQSDERGVDYAVLGGYDPREATKTFELFLRLKKESGQGEDRVKVLFATHPLDSDRIQEIDSYIQETQPTIASGEFQLKVSGPRWEQIVGSVRKAETSYRQYEEAMALVEKSRQEKNQADLDRAETLVRRAISELPGHAPLQVGLGIIALERDDLGQARTALDRACAADPKLFKARYVRGLVFQRSDAPRRALDEFRAASELYPLSPLPSLQLGRIHEVMNDREQAAQAYEDAMSKSQPNGVIHAEAQERLNSLRRG